MALTKEQINEFKETLQRMQSKYTRSLKGSTAEVKTPDEATGYSQHQADQGTDDFDRMTSIELISQSYALLRQIERALEKIDEGTYGVCDLSHEEIPIARLRATPYATTTVKAQERLEKGLL